ncbi:hypothetical protein TWF569_011114 [Orbilia oligospora]|uniref:Putative zinc-finger domain-containing protein n=1 Tax=Orbilia oligospora TaxID=2813651 RepID=A0A7C8JGA0_ORBOL|nr:hypothetical protein TWF706_004998 [Orbilia oligospora]KAF3107136.1 hypothetical protein TWF102_000969 [Orbilia oligospora]KAF3131666.1 hypothetical protein TWF569_011114 [Orbilia oligospora]KAF3142958.1 hypothetical protein TWF594_005348 [Orbilia oligospora]
MSSTCPEVPSFAGIRHGPAAGKRAMPARRAMPKPRQPSTSTASVVPKTPITPVTPGEEPSKPNLTISVPPISTSSQRDEGPEEGEISDDEDDHYSPREATTPIQIHQTLPLANPFQAVLAASMQAPLINPFPVASTNDQPSIRKEQLNSNTAAPRPTQETDPALMSMLELRKAAQSAVMYLSCSARMSFEQIVAEGIERTVLAGIYNHLKLPIPDSSKNVPTTVLPKNTAPGGVVNGLKATIPTPTIPKPEISAAPPILPTSLPPKPPTSVATSNNLPSVVSRFNQSLPGLSITQPSPNRIVSPPLPTPQPNALREASPTPQPPTLRGRKRPVAADFDIEIKPAILNPKQPRFGNRQRLESSQLIFNVSDNEEEEGKEKKQKTPLATPQSVGPSRPDSANPEKNEQLGESLRLTELAIEEMKQRIAVAMKRKPKPASNGESQSDPPSKHTTPLPATPSTDLLNAKEASLDRVEEFLHKTLDQFNAGIAQPEAVEKASELAAAELMDVEAKIDGLDVAVVINTPPSTSSPEKYPTLSADDSEDKDIVTMSDSSDLQTDDKSLESSPADSESVDEDADGLGSPMDLSDLDTTSDESDQDSSDSESDLDAEGSDSNNISEQVSSDDSADIEMHSTSGEESPASDSASSPVQETPNDDDGYDPEAHKSTIGEVSILTATSEAPPNQPSPLIIGVSEPGQPPAICKSPHDQPKKPETGFIEYQSQLSGFRSFRYHPSYNQLVSQGYKSLTYSNHIDSELPVCDFETRGGTCNDPQCRWQHFRQMALPESNILLELAEPDANQDDKEEYKGALDKIMSQLDNSDSGGFDKIAKEVIEYRRQTLGDPTRIIKGL